MQSVLEAWAGPGLRGRVSFFVQFRQDEAYKLSKLCLRLLQRVYGTLADKVKKVLAALRRGNTRIRARIELSFNLRPSSDNIAPHHEVTAAAQIPRRR